MYAGGVGYHVEAVLMTNAEQLVTWGKFAFVYPILYIPSVTFPKLAVLVLDLKIFTLRPYRLACWITGGFLVTNCIASLITVFVICRPFNYMWTNAPGGRCGDFNTWYKWNAMANILTDIVLLILPIPMIRELKATTRVKIGLALTFALGNM